MLNLRSPSIVLKVFPKLNLNFVNKNLRVSVVFLEENFEIRLCDRSYAFVTALVLGLFNANSITKI